MPPYRKPLKIIPTQDELREVFRRMAGNPRMAALMMYGKDVSEIRSAQERMQRDLDTITRDISDLRVEIARK